MGRAERADLVTKRGDLMVAIVGAGAAGLAAARRLREAGIATTVLEARSRIGGRAWTIRHGDSPLDLGCGWLHSADRNPWTALVPQLGLTVDRTPSPWGRQYRDLGFSPQEQAGFHRESEAFYARIEEAALSGPDRPASDFLAPGGRWNGLMNAVSSYVNGVELDGLSVLDFHRYSDTGTNWRVREGYGAAIAAFGRDISVRLDCSVSCIDRSGPMLRLATPAGDVLADRVIVTVPSSLIACESLRFTPALPAKVEAAQGLPLGVANKLMLALEAPGDMGCDGHVFGRTDQAGTGSYHLRPLGRPTVEAYFGGALAAGLEAEGPQAFAAFAFDELAGLFGADIRRRLRPIASTAWRNDPFSLGSYSHALPGRADERARLAEPVEDRIFFAGEACSRHDFSTAHGAYLTGIAAAEAIIG